MTLNHSGLLGKEGDGGIIDRHSRSGILSIACNARHPSLAVEGLRAAENGRERILDILVV